MKKQIALTARPGISLSLNVPGFPKSNPIATSFFAYCLRDLKYALKANLVTICEQEAIESCDAAGDFFMVPCAMGALSLQTIKQVCEDFEQSHALGRFIDADLNDQNGETVSSGKSKLCFFCLERPAIECRREEAHDVNELRNFMFPKMEGYCREQREILIIRKLSELAQRAVLAEISLTPKPGLVDRLSTGSHADMNYETFIHSTAAISPWFGDLVREGFSYRNNDLKKALPVIRGIGLRMESAMFEATQNINTQKGIIFLMGVALFACGKLFGQNDRFNPTEFREIVKEMCSDLVEKELCILSDSGHSHGEQIYRKYGFSGARGEAKSGFATVFEFGLPVLTNSIELNDESLIKSFLAIAANNNDTNILYRSDPGVLGEFKQLCNTALLNYCEESYSAVIDFCKGKNISPGGSADLLAVTIFIWSVMNIEGQFGLQ